MCKRLRSVCSVVTKTLRSFVLTGLMPSKASNKAFDGIKPVKAKVRPVSQTLAAERNLRSNLLIATHCDVWTYVDARYCVLNVD